MKVVYGVCGEGLGHATRSMSVLDQLSTKGDEFEVFSSGRAYKLLAERYDRVSEIKGFNLTYKDDQLLNTISTVEVIKTLPKDFLPTFKHVLERFRSFEPNVVITDHETFTALIGKILGVPVIYAGNIAIADRTRIDVEFERRYPKLITRTVTRLSSFNAAAYIIPTFFFPETIGDNVVLTDPPIRSEIRAQEPRDEDYLLAYNTSGTNERFVQALKDSGVPCRVYGFGERPAEGEVEFRTHDAARFAQDLANCKAAVLGGGFSTMGEAIYLRKPIYSVPLQNHFEQIVNATYLEKRTFGEHHEEPDGRSIFDFTLKLDLYRHYLARYEIDPDRFAVTTREVAKLKSAAPRTSAVERALNVLRGS